jgi:signal transduction histidine kinase
MQFMKPRLFQKHGLLELPAILALIGVSVSGLAELEEPRLRMIAAGLLICFVIVFLAYHSGMRRVLFEHARIAVLTGIVGGLLFIRPGWSVFPILFFILGAQVMVIFPLPAGLSWIGVFTLVTGLGFYAADGLGGLLTLVPFAAGYVFFGIFGWVMVQAERARARSEELLAELQQAHQQLREYAARAEELAIVQERSRMAREMHDNIGHRLTIASVQLEGAQRLIQSDPGRAEHILTTAREQVREGLTELRRTVAMFRAAVDEDLPLPQALSRLASQVEEATGIRIHLSLEECMPALPAPYRQAFYRAAQEGLTNITRHAKASEAWLQLSRGEGQVTLLVSDNGVGILPEEQKDGFGLIGLRERSSLLNGDFFVDSRAGGGTQITFRLPFSEDSQNG